MMITIKFLFVILLLRVTVLSVVMLIVDIKPMMLAVNIQCHYAQCHYADCFGSKTCGKTFMSQL
jgi:hypothetical protein